jgi:tRNA-2-methylthio-N6-dimethylallyladenosine synthase
MHSNKNTQKGLYIKNFGCQMNVYDGDRMQEMMSPYDYGSVNSVEDADLVILNTCHIREKASEKMYSDIGRLSKFKNNQIALGKNMTIAICGCVAQAEGKEILKKNNYLL